MNAADLIKAEFPDYPIDTLPQDIPAWLHCCAWHNDSCPVWGDEAYVSGDGGVGVGLAIDHPDHSMRDYGGEAPEVPSPRFSCWQTDIDGSQIGDAFVSDDWAAMLVRLEEIRPAP